MSRKRVKATEWTCDRRGCHERALAPIIDDDGPAPRPPGWCVLGAIRKVFCSHDCAREYDDGPEGAVSP